MPGCLLARYHSHLERGLEAAVGVAAAAGLVPLITGAHGISLGPWVIPVREVWRPLGLAAVLAACRAALAWRATPMRRVGESLPAGRSWPDIAVTLVLSFALASAAMQWTRLHVRYCGGLDSYGYVSAAEAIAAGNVIHPEPMVDWLPFAHAIDAATPLGWIAAPSRRAIVPAYPLGFPMVMAAFIRLSGLGAAFYVPLLAGVGTVVIAYRAGRRLGGPLAAAAVAIVVASNPVLVNMAVQPMSDVPATFWYLLALALLAAMPARPALAGLAFAMAVWTRPLVLALLPALLVVLPQRREALARFAAGAAAVIAAMAGMQWWLYGSPLRTGYGGTAGLFTTQNIGRHLGAFARWTMIIHTPLFLLALVAGVWRAPRRYVVAALVGLVTGVVPYLFNLQYFDDWDLIRYILPGLIPCIIVAVLGIVSVAERAAPRPVATLLVLCLAVAIEAGSFRFVAAQSTAQLRFQESRYAEVADWFRAHSPPGAVVLADLHSGSLRLYSGRPTLRWVRMPPGSLAPTLAAARRRGISCYAALDGEPEVRSFEQQLAAEPDGIVAEPVARVRTTTIVLLSLASKGG